MGWESPSRQHVQLLVKVTAPKSAPPWAHDLARNAQQVIDNEIWPYVRRRPVPIADLPSAADNAWKKFFVSDGASGMPEVTSNGQQWVYPDGTTV